MIVRPGSRRDLLPVLTILHIKFEDITFVNPDDTTSAVEQFLKDVRVITGQTMEIDMGINNVSSSPKTPRTTFSKNNNTLENTMGHSHNTSSLVTRSPLRPS